MSRPPPPPNFKKVFDAAWENMRKTYGGGGGGSGGAAGGGGASSGAGGANPRMITGSVIAASVLGIGAYTLYHSMFFVPGGHRAVKFNAVMGLYDQTYGEGAHLLIPYLETPIFFDVRTKPTEVVTSTGSRDLQLVNMSVRVLYRPQLQNLHYLYRSLGVKYAYTVLPSIINEVIKSVVAQYNASELLTRRPEVSKQIAAHLITRAGVFHIDISDVSITNMTFGKEYTAAIEAKQIAQQMAERAKFLVDQALQEKRGAIVLAEGEAESARLLGEAMRSQPGFLEIRRMEAARVIAKPLVLLTTRTLAL
jgi:prohibitin 2